MKSYLEKFLLKNDQIFKKYIYIFTKFFKWVDTNFVLGIHVVKNLGANKQEAAQMKVATENTVTPASLLIRKI